MIVKYISVHSGDVLFTHSKNEYVPRQNDLIRLEDTYYRVREVVWLHAPYGHPKTFGSPDMVEVYLWRASEDKVI